MNIFSCGCSLEQSALSKPQAAFEESLIAVNLVSVASDKKRKRAPQLNIFTLQRPYTPQFAWKGVTNEF